MIFTEFGAFLKELHGLLRYGMTFLRNVLVRVKYSSENYRSC